MGLTRQEERVEYFLALASKIFVWGLLLAIVFLLRSFFLLIFLTFVFAYIQGTVVQKLAPHIPNRILRTVLVTLALLMVLLAVGAYLVPQFKEQAKIFVDSYPRYISTLDAEIEKLSQQYPILQGALIQEDSSSQVVEVGGKPSPAATLLQKLFNSGSNHQDDEVAHVFQVFRNVGSSLMAIASAFFLSLLFSFLIILDLPSLIQSVQSLKNTRLQFVYEEVAESIRDFGIVVGRAMEAQLFIALLNMVLTGAGLVLLGLGKHLAFLSVVVFICSFIPVAGAFISSAPICLVAFQESGLGLVLMVVLLICIVHAVEAYILNPRIYGHHMRMNPVIVLAILTIAGKMFHVWGLVLGVPVCNYIFGHAIQRKTEQEYI